MATSKPILNGVSVVFVDLDPTEAPPRFAIYAPDAGGRPAKKIGGFDGKTLTFDPGETGEIILGPDVENPASLLDPETLKRYRVAQILPQWRETGVVLGPDVYDRFRFRFTCVSGTVKKCRPWYWDVVAELPYAKAARLLPITADLQPHLHFPLRCTPLCDGKVEIYQRTCCCTWHCHPRLIIDRLRIILEQWPVPPIPDPGPLKELGNLRALSASPTSGLRRVAPRATTPAYSALPPQYLYEDLAALVRLDGAEAERYLVARPYLCHLLCSCTLKKIGETDLQPNGEFDFCYRTSLLDGLLARGCSRSYVYKVKQFINGAWVVVYDGIAAHNYFSTHNADLHVYDPRARVCSESPGNPPPNDGAAFVMLEHVGVFGTFHYNFPNQNGVSQVAALDADDGTYDTSYAPDCPWGGGLNLRLWFSPELEGTVAYYRLKAVRVNDAGVAVGAPQTLNAPVSWSKFVTVNGDIVLDSDLLGPNTVGPEAELYKVPYWSSPNRRYLASQFHQTWNTAQFADGKYLLLLEVFDAGGNRIKPNGATGPGAAKAFQFRRWASGTDTDPVAFADVAHVFWVDNTPVNSLHTEPNNGIVDLRQNGIPNTAECQFLVGSANDTLAIGLRAYHVHGVEHAGNGDTDSFMWTYAISWQRGLNGASGALGFAPSGGSDHTDVGETGAAVSSGSESFGTMLGDHTKCSFSVTLSVYAKHFTGSSRIQAYDYYETASFALEITP